MLQLNLPLSGEIKYLQDYLGALKAAILDSLDLPDNQVNEMIALEKYIELRIGNLRQIIKGRIQENSN